MLIFGVHHEQSDKSYILCRITKDQIHYSYQSFIFKETDVIFIFILFIWRKCAHILYYTFLGNKRRMILIKKFILTTQIIYQVDIFCI